MTAAEEIFLAIAAGDQERVRELVEDRPEVAAARDEDGLSAVLRAAYAGKGALVDLLLDANPSLDVFDTAATGRDRGLEELVEAEPGLARSWSPDGFTPLHLAAFFGNEGAARLLLEHGADANVVARHATLQVAPIHSAAAGGHTGIVTLLLEAGADATARQNGGFTPLHSAAQNGDRESVEALLEGGADAGARDDEGQTPADLAAAAGHDELVDFLTP
ncbi:MAG: ankyrin repeat domain-containing protein [Actinobacteria bacterium]|nr:ankyrin repeat domain-containing protein [Actinomycetota bacterium]